MNTETKIKYVAFNTKTRRYEEVHAEDEVIGNNVITLYWSGAISKWVSIPE